jgi:maleate cis-trans isomerase
MIVPSGGPEGDYYGYEEATKNAVRFFFCISRVGGEPGKDHDRDALRQTAQVAWLVEAAERLRQMRLDALSWACTSGSFILGRQFAEGQVKGLTAAFGIPASSTSLAFTAACERLDVRRVGVLATYPEEAARAFVSFLAEFGIEVADLHWMGAPSGWDAAKFDAAYIAENARKLQASGMEAILIPDTALPSLHFVADLERDLGVTLLTANAVTVWDAQRIAGSITPVTGHGRLLASS